MWPSAAATASSLNDRKQRLMTYLKTKRDEYLQNSDDDDDMGASRSIDSTNKQIPLNEPFAGEQLTLYPAYSFLGPMKGGYRNLIVNLSGLLWLPALPNRKNRIMVAIARQIAGAEQPNSDEDAPRLPSRESTLDILEEEASEYMRMNPERQSRSSPSISTGDELAQSQSERTLRERIAPFLARAAPNREVSVISDNGAVHTSIISNNSGRLHKRLELPFGQDLGRNLIVRASANLQKTTPIIFIPPQGISVISDIDDTIKKTGVTGVKREMFRNVFVRGFSDLQVTGITDWYQALSALNCMFHYVSNSPSQLYPVVRQFLESAGLPPGTIHLKQYTGLINGIMEPSSERKKPVLHGLLADFPERKFILIGDSGESDLEAYMELATAFPDNILAIYIRDITSPMQTGPRLPSRGDNDVPFRSGDSMASRSTNDMSSRSVNDTPYRSANGTSSRDIPSRSADNMQSRSADNIPDLIDLDDKPHGRPPPLPPRSLTTTEKKQAPPLPPKPNYMRSVKRKPIEPRPAEVFLGPDVAPESPLAEWASRVKYANRTIPPHIQFSLFKDGNDLKTISLDLVKRNE